MYENNAQNAGGQQLDYADAQTNAKGMAYAQGVPTPVSAPIGESVNALHSQLYEAEQLIEDISMKAFAVPVGLSAPQSAGGGTAARAGIQDDLTHANQRAARLILALRAINDRI